MKPYAVYILASKRNGTLYTGVTNDIERRIVEHKEHIYNGFSHTHNVTNLVYVEYTDSIESAIAREKQIKHWKRAWRTQLIEKNNPQWHDLANSTNPGSPRQFMPI